MTNPSILILPGDGIGPEVMKEVRKVIDWYGTNLGLAFDVSEDLVGGVAYDAHGVPLHDTTLAKAQEVDAVLLGAFKYPKDTPLPPMHSSPSSPFFTFSISSFRIDIIYPGSAAPIETGSPLNNSA